MENNETAPIGVHVSGVLKKFTAKPDGTSWTDEEIEAGLADEHLYETITFEDGEPTKVWRKEN